MPQELFIPLGATAFVPVVYSYPQTLPVTDPAHPLPAAKDARVMVDKPEIEGAPTVVAAKLREDGQEIAITGTEPGAATVRIRTGDSEDVINITVAPLVANGVSAHTDAVRYDLSKVAGPPQPKPSLTNDRDAAARHDADAHQHPSAGARAAASQHDNKARASA